MKILTVLMTLLSTSVFAQNLTTPNYGNITLIDGGRVNGNQLVGMVIDLNETEHWKTYWRTSGQNGLSPVFNFDASDNIGEIKQYWPEPYLIGDEGVEAVGYTKDVIVVFEITPEDASQNVILDFTADIGVCQNICLPVQKAFRQQLNPSYSIDGTTLQVAMVNAFDENYAALADAQKFDKVFYLQGNSLISAEDYGNQACATPTYALNSSGAMRIC